MIVIDLKAFAKKNSNFNIQQLQLQQNNQPNKKTNRLLIRKYSDVI